MRLGSFQLFDQIGTGSTGVVRRGVHDEGTPVAVKIVAAGSDAARARFRDEVHAMARLDHPGILRVYDHGLVPEGVDDLVAGSPWVAVELATGGTLNRRVGQQSWPEVQRTLTALLAALAHAHAQDVIHRDLKPANLLLAGRGDARPGLKVADFGLARALDRTDTVGRAAGTPLYMAPEQIRNQWRDFGPWTDLYAVGMLTWALVAGRAPYEGLPLQRMVQSHLQGTRPPLSPRMPVPEDLVSWLEHLLQTDPRDRYRCAADAAAALSRLGPPVGSTVMDTPHMAPMLTSPTLILGDTPWMAEDRGNGPAPRRPVLAPISPAPLPVSWRGDDSGPDVDLIRTGLSLFGLRTVPLVGRGAEQDRLWSALREVEAHGGVRVVCLSGASGNGKSRLAHWLATRAQQAGGLRLLKLIHSPEPTPLDGLVPAVARWTRCIGLDRETTEQRLAVRGLPDERLAPLVSLLHPPGPAEEGLRLTSEIERFEVVRQLLADEDRPVAVWVDDVQWSPEGLALTEFLLERPSGRGLLVMLTARDEALVDHPERTARLERLLDDARCERIELRPLPPAASRTLVERLLGLQGDLAQHLATRTAGNPLFMVQLVEDWVARGALVAGDDGLVLLDGVSEDVPGSMHAVWARRVDELLRAWPTARGALELAAALGQEVHEDRWAAICSRCDVPLPDGLVTAMLERRLALRNEEGFSFAHGMLRESLERQAREAGRWAAANRRCAQALSDLEPEQHERLGRHWLAAGDGDLAVRELTAAVERTSREGSGPVLVLLERALLLADVDAADPRWGELWLRESAHHRATRRGAAAEASARRALGAAQTHGWERLQPAARLALADVARLRGEFTAAIGIFVDAIAALEAAGGHVAGGTWTSLADVCIRAGRPEEAEEPLERAEAVFAATDDLAGLAQVRRFEGDLARLRGRYTDARRCFVEASEINRRAGLRANAAAALHGVAEMDRLLGDLDAAEEGYRHVIALNEARGATPTGVPSLNLGLCLLARDRFGAARRLLTQLLVAWQRRGLDGYAAMAHTSLLLAVAGCGDWEAFDHHLDEGDRLGRQTGVIDVDAALACEEAGDHAELAGELERAHGAFLLAHHHRAGLGDTTGAARDEARLTNLERLLGRTPARHTMPP